MMTNRVRLSCISPSPTPLRHASPSGRRQRCAIQLLVLVLLSLEIGLPFFGPGAAAAGPPSKSQQQKPAPSQLAKPAPKALPLPEPDVTKPLAKQYCDNIRDKAAEARFESQMAQLDEMAQHVEERVRAMTAQSKELQDWLAKREGFSQKATAHLVGIFSSMRSEAASEQLSRLSGETAAAILLKLDQKVASAILNDMPPEKAAKLAAILVDASRRGDGDNAR